MSSQPIPRVYGDHRIFAVIEFTRASDIRPSPTQAETADTPELKIIDNDGESPDCLETWMLRTSVSSLHSANLGGFPIVHPSRSDDRFLWETVPGGGLVVSDDFHSAVLSALGGDTKAHPDRGRRLRALRLSPVGLNLLNGGMVGPSGNPAEWAAKDQLRFDHRRRGIALTLTPSAKRRVGTSLDELFVVIHAVEVIRPSHLRLMIAELEIVADDGPVSPEAVAEALCLLANRNHERSNHLASLTLTDGDAPVVSLVRMLSLLLPTAATVVDVWNRLYTYTVFLRPRFQDALGRAEETLAFRTARHYTTDYQVTAEERQKFIVRPFATVAHGFCLEGAASVLDTSDPFFGSQGLNKVRNAYRWLVALAYHEHAYLLLLVQGQIAQDPENSLSSSTERGLRRRYWWISLRNKDRIADSTVRLQSARVSNAHRPTSPWGPDHVAEPDLRDLRRMSAILKSFTAYRLRYRLPIVSDIEMHNQAYLALRKGLRLDELSAKLAGDTKEYHHYIVQKIAENDACYKHELKKRRMKSARMDAFFSGGIIFGLSFLAFSSLGERMAKLIYIAAYNNLPESEHPWIGLIVGLVAATLAGTIHTRKLLREAKDERDEERVMDAATETASDSDTYLATKAGIAGS